MRASNYTENCLGNCVYARCGYFLSVFYGRDSFSIFMTRSLNDFDLIKAKEIAQFLNVDLDSKIKNLSKGNRGRVKIAVTLGREASYYLLDEPFSGLDPMVRDDISKGLIRFTDTERQTVLMSTHELKEVEPLLDEIVVLREGEIIAQ